MKKRILVPVLIVGTLLTGSLASAGPGVFGAGHGSKGGDCNDRGQGGMSYEQHAERL